MRFGLPQSGSLDVRIRQVRPEFFTDPITARLPAEVRLFYIGLWCVADDAGYLEWNVDQLGALLYPYQSIRVRTRTVERAGECLVTAGRLRSYTYCECRLVTHLEEHQKIGGNKSFVVRDEHLVHTRLDKSIHAREITLPNLPLQADKSGLKDRLGAYEDVVKP
jgi:hypothetical protein